MIVMTPRRTHPLAGLGAPLAVERGPAPGWMVAWRVLAAVSAGASAYHGYKRNRGAIGWTIGWALLGGIFPIITPAVALAQGFGKPA